MSRLIECPCTKLTGLSRHDCPACGGEGICRVDHPQRPSMITPEEIDEAIEAGRRDAKEVNARLKGVFGLPHWSPRFR